ncbi:MAG: LacI family DNA-binding transcriptional regulator [Tepidisphaeraceae bacterium]
MKRPGTKRITLADVAAKAGVSVATASVAITGRRSGNCRVSLAVAEKIRRAARQLDYRPNLQARMLSTQRTHNVAVLIKRASWHNAMFYVSSAQRVLREHGYSESFMLHPDNTVASEREHLEICLQRGVEGVLAIPLIDPNGQANVELFNRLHQQENIPVVQLGTALPGCVAPSVTVDIIGSLRKTITLLHAMGHRQIAMSTVPGYDSTDALSPQHFAHLVYLGYRAGMADLGLAEQVFVAPGQREDVTTQYDRSVPLGAEVAKASPRPTAIVAFSEYAAAGLMVGLAEKGLRVPEDVSVVAGGEQPFARMLRPALTTLAAPYERMGEIATDMLLKMIDGGEATSLSLSASLIMRDSVRKLPD